MILYMIKVGGITVPPAQGSVYRYTGNKFIKANAI